MSDLSSSVTVVKFFPYFTWLLRSGNKIMAEIYVSDVLEELTNSSNIRGIVRKQCESILKDVPLSVVAELQKIVTYASGKCMGYPSIWLSQKALALSDNKVVEMLLRQPGPIYISLTTSIADDFIDKDESVDPSYMMVFYLFVFNALRQPLWFSGAIEAKYKQEVYPLIESFVSSSKSFTDIGSTSHKSKAEKAGRRIGAFHETVALEFSNQLVAGKEQRNNLCFIAGKFGEWCSYFDDMLDVEVDIEGGDIFSLPIYYICNESKELAEAVKGRNIYPCMEFIASDRFITILTECCLDQLMSLKVYANQFGFNGLAKEFDHVMDRAPAIISKNRLRLSNRARSLLV